MVIVANPRSGWRAQANHVARVASVLDRHGLRAEILWEPPEPGFHRAYGDASACRAVVVAGGDGTVNRVLNCRPPVPVAVLPLGTENLFARALGFALDAETLARRIVAGRTSPLDLGIAGDRYFGLVASAGFDADVAHRFDRWRRHGKRVRRATHLHYARPVIESFCGYGHSSLTLETDRGPVRGSLAMIFNLSVYIRGLRLLPQARADDGRLDWLVFQRPGSFSLLGLLMDIARGRHLERPDLVHGQARSLVLRSEGSVPVQVDGEALGATPIEITVVPGALQVLGGA